MLGSSPSMTCITLQQRDIHAQLPTQPARHRRAGPQALARRAADRAARGGPPGLDAARLCGARPRGLSAQRGRASLRAADRRGGGAAAADRQGRRARDAGASAARAARPAQSARGRHRASSRCSTATCSSPATPMSRRSSVDGASRASSTRCGPTGCASCPAATAGRRPTTTRSAGETVRFRPGRGRACRRSCISRCSIRSTTITASRRSRRRPCALDIHNAAGAWNKALLDNAARPSGALVYAGPDGAEPDATRSSSG